MDVPTFNETTSERHKEEAASNYHICAILCEQGKRGWAVVLLFYSALHLVEAYKCIHHPDEVFKDHGQRLDYVSDELRMVHTYYETLYSMSRSVRYDLYQCGQANLDFAHTNYNSLWDEMKAIGITYDYP